MRETAPEAVQNSHGAGLTRRTVVEHCVLDLAEFDLDESPETIDELYQLVIEANPELDSDNVQLDPRAASATKKRSDADLYRRRLKNLARNFDARLGKHIVGQENALRALARAARRAALGWGERGPLTSLLLVGPTGTGKTESARALAQELSPTGRAADALIRIDGPEFGERHETSKLIGAPPGYIGHGEPGLLARGLERNPRSVLLVDEVEKADSRLHDLLLQILDEGYITEGQGRRLDFSQCFLILTSNVGTRKLATARTQLGFASAAPAAVERRSRFEIVASALGERFRPEFLARLEDVILFDDLDAESSLEIARRALTDLAARVRRSGARVRFTRAVAPWLAQRGSLQGEGARGILHLLQRRVEAPLAEQALDVHRGQWLEVSIRRALPQVRRRTG